MNTMHKRKGACLVWLFAVLLIAAGCDSGHGPDSLFAPQTGAVSAGCVACHNSTSTIAPDPETTNVTKPDGTPHRITDVVEALARRQL